MRTLRDLADDLEEMADNLPLQIATNLSVETVEVMLVYLLQATPVDTSQALSNWQVTLNVPAEEILPAYYPGEQGSTAVISREAALKVAKEVLAKKQPGDTVYITNCLPYIDGLDKGDSDQNPGGFVAGATMLGRLFAENPSNFPKAG